MPTIAEVLDHTRRYRAEHPHQRLGQAVFNGVYDIAPEVADELRSTDRDPFYNDAESDAFLDAVWAILERDAA